MYATSDGVKETETAYHKMRCEQGFVKQEEDLRRERLIRKYATRMMRGTTEHAFDKWKSQTVFAKEPGNQTRYEETSKEL